MLSPAGTTATVIQRHTFVEMPRGGHQRGAEFSGDGTEVLAL